MLVPSEGVHEAVLIEVRERGEAKTTFGVTLQCSLVWQTEEGPVEQRFNQTLHEKSRLSKVVKALGHVPVSGFDLDTLLGAKCRLVIGYAEDREGSLYVKVEAILRPVKEQRQRWNEEAGRILGITRRQT
jgi:hypothetical protein